MVEGLATDWRTVDVSERLFALFEYAEKLTRAPASVGPADVAALRSHGLDDEAILHACEVVSYFNLVNRMADGLGVPLEDTWSEPPIGPASP